MGKKKLAVVIDDEKFIRDLLDKVLTSLGYETKTYECALDVPCVKEHSKDHCQFEDGPPEVLITDIKMPGMSGPEFLLKTQEMGCKAKKVAIMSGLWKKTDSEVLEKINCRKFKKPFTIKEMSDWINEE